MKSKFFYALTLIGASVLGYTATYFFLDQKIQNKPGESLFGPVNIYPEFEDMTDATLVAQAKKLYKQKKYERAFRMYETAFRKSQSGSKPRKWAAHRLGYMYFKGKGVEKNLVRAKNYLTQPELAKSGGANFDLGMLYAIKEFELHDLDKARFYLTKAESIGVKAATNALAKLK